MEDLLPNQVLLPHQVEEEISHITDHLMGEILTLIDAVIEKDRQCEKTKDTIRQFFASYREMKWQMFAPYRKVASTEK